MNVLDRAIRLARTAPAPPPPAPRPVRIAITDSERDAGPVAVVRVEPVIIGLGDVDSDAEWLAGAVLRICAAAYAVPRIEILSYRRDRTAVLARHVAMYLIKTLTRLTLTRIGALFGRDHTTVLHAVRKVARRIETDAALAAQVSWIETRIRFGARHETLHPQFDDVDDRHHPRAQE